MTDNTEKPKPQTEAEWMEFYKDRTFDQLLRRVAELECLKKSLTERLNPRGRW